MCPGMTGALHMLIYTIYLRIYYEMHAKVYNMHAKVSYSSTIPACRLIVVTSPQVDSENDNRLAFESEDLVVHGGQSAKGAIAELA